MKSESCGLATDSESTSTKAAGTLVVSSFGGQESAPHKNLDPFRCLTHRTTKQCMYSPAFHLTAEMFLFLNFESVRKSVTSSIRYANYSFEFIFELIFLRTRTRKLC